MKENYLSKQSGWIRRLIHYISPSFLIILFVIMWHMVAMTGKTMLPTPGATMERLIRVWGSTIAKVPMIVHVGVSIRRIVIAITLAILLGIPFGVGLGWNTTFRALFKPIFEIIRPIPPISLVPLFTLWFGTGEFSRILIIFFGVLMPIVVNSYSGVAMIPPINIEVGKSFGATNRNLMFDIVLPSSISVIFAGIRTALGTGWMVLLAAEMLAAKSGIGFLIMQGSNANDLTLAIVGMIMIGVLGAGFAYFFDFIELRLCPWKRT